MDLGAVVCHVDKILDTIREAAKVRGTGIAERTHEYVTTKMKEGKAIIALCGEDFAGFTYIESWGNKQYVAVEEIDALAPEQKNKAKFADGSTAACGLLCDLMHLEGAKALASYEEDFYAGMPAASKNTYGKGTTYYIATQFEEEGLAKILDQAVQEAGVSSVIPEETGLEVVTRVSDTTRFYFVMNFTDEEQILPESLTGKKDMISQKMTEHGMKLKKWDVLLLEEHL